MSNLTITIDEGVLRKARIRALEQGSSVNAVLRELLEVYAGVRDSQAAAAADLVELSTKSRSRRGATRPIAPRRAASDSQRAASDSQRVASDPQRVVRSPLIRTFFDTNVLVCLFDADAPAKQARTRELLAHEADAGRATSSTQVLQEFFVAVTRKFAVPLAVEEAERVVRRLADLSIVHVDPTLILGAIGASIRSGISFRDALIIRAAQQSGAEILYTEDLQNGRRFDGREIVDPFRER